jgi:hypothetical protein
MNTYRTLAHSRGDHGRHGLRARAIALISLLRPPLPAPEPDLRSSLRPSSVHLEAQRTCRRSYGGRAPRAVPFLRAAGEEGCRRVLPDLGDCSGGERRPVSGLFRLAAP